jgi:histidinol-phosphate/aromatic aminotransferase/cobyric acid decarboxylase-like protein
MVVIADTRLIERRLQTLRARRDQLTAPRGSRRPLPDWAAETLMALGMTRAEIAADEAALALEPSPDERERELAETEAAIEALEEELLLQGDGSAAALHALAELALARLKRSTTVDPKNVFYDAGEARAVALFEQVVSGLDRLRRTDWRRTG